MLISELFQSPISGHWFVDTIAYAPAMDQFFEFQSPMSGHWFVDSLLQVVLSYQGLSFQSPMSGHWFVDSPCSRTFYTFYVLNNVMLTNIAHKVYKSTKKHIPIWLIFLNMERKCPFSGYPFYREDLIP